MTRRADELILAGDLGGTKTLLELSQAGAVERRFERRYLAAEHVGFGAMLRCFLDEFARESGAAPHIAAACIAVAGPVTGDRVRVTNLPWEIGAAEIAAEFGIDRVRLVNDFEASAYGLDALGATDLFTVQAATADPHGHRVVLGAGTGLGVAYSIWTRHGRRVIAGEGGHAGFAPRDDVQCELWREVRKQTGYVACEDLLSGPGLERIYDFLRQRAAAGAAGPAGGGAPQIAARGLGGDPLAAAALALFARIFGAVAGDHALNVMARGGVYLAGGIAPKVLTHIAPAEFLGAFREKGAHAQLMQGFPVLVVLNERLGLIGARRVVNELIQVKTA
jgi:glucokinase